MAEEVSSLNSRPAGLSQDSVRDSVSEEDRRHRPEAFKAPGSESAVEKSAAKKSQVGFYHLTRSSLEEALPLLLDRTLQAGERAAVYCPDEETVLMLDKALWASRACPWLPHGRLRDGNEKRQPIWLTASEEEALPNGAGFLFRVNGAGNFMGEHFTGASFQRVFDLFDGTDERQVAEARSRWRACKEAGHVLTYWKQVETGWRRAG